MFDWLKSAPSVQRTEPVITKPAPKPRVEPTVAKPKPKISDMTLARAGEPTRLPPSINPPQIPRPFPGVVPANASLAMDRDLMSIGEYAMQNGLITEGLTFLGYPYLAELSQRPEYRHIVQTIAREMTRKWITLHSTGNDSASERIDALVDAMSRYHVRQIFKRITELDGFFGRAHIFIDTGYPLGDSELEKLLMVSKAKVPQGGLKRLSVIEPMWTYPADYNAIDPTREGFYHPESWWIQGKRVHGSRLLTFVGRPVPDMIKPLYQFGGLSMTQMAKPYVDNFLQVRTDVADLITSFSILGLKTDMDAALSGDAGDSLFRRVDLFNRIKSNRGTMLLNQGEEFFNVTTPLGTLDHLQAQSQEQIASVSGIPLVKLLGITPSGLNASSEDEIRVFYDTIQAIQEDFFRPHLKRIIDLIQLSEFGDIDEQLTFRFVPLWEMDEGQKAQIRGTNATTAAEMIQVGIISAAEERERLAKEEDGLYNNIDLSVVPEIPGAEPQEGGPEGDDDDGGGGSSGDGPPAPDAPPRGQDAAMPGQHWEESKHKRDPDGKFGSGGGGSPPSVPLVLEKFGDPKVIDALSRDDNNAVHRQLHELYNSDPEYKQAVDVLASYVEWHGAATDTRYILAQALEGKSVDQIMSSGKIGHLPKGKVAELVASTKGYYSTLRHAPEMANETFRGCKSLKAKVGQQVELRGPTAFSADMDSAMTYSGGSLVRVEPGAKMLPMRAMTSSSKSHDEHSTVAAFWSRSENKAHPKGPGHGFSIDFDTDRELNTSGRFEVTRVEKQPIEYTDTLTGKKRTRSINVVYMRQVGVF